MPQFLKQLLLSNALLGAACSASSSASLINVFNDTGFLLFAIGLPGPLLLAPSPTHLPPPRFSIG